MGYPPTYIPLLPLPHTHISPCTPTPAITTPITCRLNPYVASQYDGISLHPYEVLFVKVKDFMLQQQWSTATSAVKYDAWSNPWVCLGCCVYTIHHETSPYPTTTPPNNTHRCTVMSAQMIMPKQHPSCVHHKCGSCSKETAAALIVGFIACAVLIW